MSLLTTAGDGGGGCNEFIDHWWGCCVLSGGKDSFTPLELVSMRA